MWAGTPLVASSFQAHETGGLGPSCAAPPLGSRQRFGYDLIAWAGLQRYHHARQRGINLSAGSVSALWDRFLHLLEQLQRTCGTARHAAWLFPAP